MALLIQNNLKGRIYELKTLADAMNFASAFKGNIISKEKNCVKVKIS